MMDYMHMPEPKRPPDPAPQPEIEMVYTIKVRTPGIGDAFHHSEIDSFLWASLNKSFGADRCEVYRNSHRVFYDPSTMISKIV